MKYYHLDFTPTEEQLAVDGVSVREALCGDFCGYEKESCGKCLVTFDDGQYDLPGFLEVLDPIDLLGIEI